ncbi:MAG TPA: rhodanese-like domain-containing protein [Thermoanaerobaculia bacterium]|jgi:rhodanese-related sulfurtransferase
MRVLAALLLTVSLFANENATIENPAIDMAGFLEDAGEAAESREGRRVTEEEFLAWSREPGTIVLDARSADKFRERHIRGAVNLSFTDFTAAALARVIPTKETRVLIYCNNNFMNDEQAFAEKSFRASLNLSTWVALHTYGYRNVYELGPRVDVNTTKLPLVSAGR